VERADRDAILVRREPRPEPARRQRAGHAEENGQAMVRACNAQDGVEERKEGRDPQTVAEPVAVEQGIPSRLVCKRAVVVAGHARLQKRAQALMDVAGLGEVVGEAGRKPGTERRDSVEETSAPRLVHEQLSDCEADQRKERAWFRQHRERRGHPSRSGARRSRAPAPNERARNRDERSDRHVGQP